MKLNNLIHWHIQERFSYLLASLGLFIILPPFLIDFPIIKYLIYALLILLILGCTLVLFDDSKRSGYSLLVAGIVIWFTLSKDGEFIAFEIFKQIAVAIFFLATARKLVLYVLKVDRVTPNVILGSISAYLLLGLVGAIFFQLVDVVYPNSFNVSREFDTFYNMVYYSFVTMSTLGYGDITPQSPQAQGIAILVSMTGQLYLAVLMAMLVGKFLSDRKQ